MEGTHVAVEPCCLLLSTKLPEDRRLINPILVGLLYKKNFFHVFCTFNSQMVVMILTSAEAVASLLAVGLSTSMPSLIGRTNSFSLSS
jgi:hypothetical protein